MNVNPVDSQSSLNLNIGSILFGTVYVLWILQSKSTKISCICRMGRELNDFPVFVNMESTKGVKFYVPCPINFEVQAKAKLQKSFFGCTFRCLHGFIECVCEEKISLPTTPSDIKEIASSCLDCDFSTGYTYAGLVKNRAKSHFDALIAQCHANPNQCYFVDIGGGDAKKTFATAALLGWPIERIRNWEVVKCDLVNEAVASFVHSAEKPFCCVESGLVQELNSVAFAMLSHVLHHIADEEHIHLLLNRLKDCMIIGGLLLLREHDCDPLVQTSLAQSLIAMHQWKDIEMRKMSPPKRMHSRDQWAELLGFYGFKRLFPSDWSPSTEEREYEEFSIPNPGISPNATFMDMFLYDPVN